MNLRDLLTEDLIRIPLQNVEKTKIIEELVEILYNTHKIDNRDQVLQAVLEREKVMSTGVGDAVAIPHGKSEGVQSLSASFGITRVPVDFDAIDDKPVRLIFLLVGSPDQTGPHLKALSRISRLLHKEEFRQQLLKAKTPKEALQAICDEEKSHFSS